MEEWFTIPEPIEPKGTEFSIPGAPTEEFPEVFPEPKHEPVFEILTEAEVLEAERAEEVEEAEALGKVLPPIRGERLRERPPRRAPTRRESRLSVGTMAGRPTTGMVPGAMFRR